MRHICVLNEEEMAIKSRREVGQVFLFVLMAMGVGALIIGPLLVHISTSLTSLRKGTEAVNQYYAADSGVEHAIWRLRYGGLSLDLESPFIYTYSTVNTLPVEVTVTKKQYITDAQCGDNIPPNQSDRVTVSRTVEPTTAPPGESTVFNYSIRFENIGTSNIHFYEIGYRLPMGFTYVDGSSGGFTTSNPVPTDGTLVWAFSPPLPSIHKDEVLTQTFQAIGVLEQGTYCEFCDVAWVIFQPGAIGGASPGPA